MSRVTAKDPPKHVRLGALDLQWFPAGYRLEILDDAGLVLRQTVLNHACGAPMMVELTRARDALEAASAMLHSTAPDAEIARGGVAWSLASKLVQLGIDTKKENV